MAQRNHFFILPVIFLLASSCARKVTESGRASFYADKFQGRRTASGETFKQQHLTAAHRSLPFGSRVKVTNLDNGRTVKVRINDRGPFVSGRIIDLSKKAARKLGMIPSGTANVKIRYKKPRR